MDVEIKGDKKEVLRRLVAPFFEQGTKPVYVAQCCGRLFAGAETPKGCRVCECVPAYVGFDSLDEVDPAHIPEQPEVRESYRS